MDRDQYSGNCLFNIEADNGGGGRGTEKDFVCRRFALVGMYARRSLRNERERKCLTQKKLRLMTSEFVGYHEFRRH